LRPQQDLRAATEQVGETLFEDMDLRAEVEPIRQRGGAGLGEGSARAVVAPPLLLSDRLLIIHRRYGEGAVTDDRSGSAVADRNDRPDPAELRKPAQRLGHPGFDSGRVERDIARRLDAIVRAGFARDHGPLARPQGQLRHGFSDVEHDRQFVDQRLSPRTLVIAFNEI
jgi:hypothetical protein